MKILFIFVCVIVFIIYLVVKNKLDNKITTQEAVFAQKKSIFDLDTLEDLEAVDITMEKMLKYACTLVLVYRCDYLSDISLPFFLAWLDVVYTNEVSNDPKFETLFEEYITLSERSYEIFMQIDIHDMFDKRKQFISVIKRNLIDNNNSKKIYFYHKMAVLASNFIQNAANILVNEDELIIVQKKFIEDVS